MIKPKQGLVHLFFEFSFLSQSSLLNFVSDRSRNKQRWIGSYDDTQQDCEGKASDRAATQDEDTQYNHQRCDRGIECTTQGRIQWVVDYLETIAFRLETDCFADTGEYNHRVIDRVTDNGQDRRDKGLIHLHWER